MKQMKALLLACGAVTAMALTGAARTYDLSWFTIDGGGGTSTGGVYSVTGTIGQPDAGVMTGGNYTLVGGFWGVMVAIQTAGAPLLTITHAGGTVVISWPSPSVGYALQVTSSLGAGNWTSVPQAPADNGTTKSVTLPLQAGSSFYRLIK